MINNDPPRIKNIGKYLLTNKFMGLIKSIFSYSWADVSVIKAIL